MEHALSPATLTELRRPRPYPAVSVLTPTHRREPDNAQDPVRLRNVVAEAKKQIESDPAVTRERRTDLVQQLDRALAEVDLAHTEEGLAIFAAPGEHQVWSLARTVPERVVLSDTFLTRNLVAAQVSERPFWVLAVSADRVTLWNGGADRVAEERIAGFPLTRRLEDPNAERKERIGDLPSTFRDERTKHFLREADTAMNAVLRENPRPLYVTGETAALSSSTRSARSPRTPRTSRTADSRRAPPTPCGRRYVRSSPPRSARTPTRWPVSSNRPVVTRRSRPESTRCGRTRPRAGSGCWPSRRTTA